MRPSSGAFYCVIRAQNKSSLARNRGTCMVVYDGMGVTIVATCRWWWRPVACVAVRQLHP